MAQLEILDDQAILDYTTEPNGRGRVLTDHRDLNLRFTPPRPIAGGVYDVDIFGSPMSDRCICGKIRKTSSEPCPFCGAKVYTVEEGLRRFARIDSFSIARKLAACFSLLFRHSACGASTLSAVLSTATLLLGAM